MRLATKQHVSDFLAEKTLALVGASRGGKKFGNSILRELEAKGYRILPVHPQATAIDGRPCWRSLQTLPEQVGGVIVVVPPDETEKVVRDAVEAGIRRVWMQQGAESAAAIGLCEQHGLDVVAGECILMFAGPTGFHRVHRFFRGILGRLPR